MEHPKCPVCLDPYTSFKNPLSLLCGHHICEKCILQLLTNNCPECRDQFIIELRAHHYNFGMIEMLKFTEIYNDETIINEQKEINKEFEQERHERKERERRERESLQVHVQDIQYEVLESIIQELHIQERRERERIVQERHLERERIVRERHLEREEQVRQRLHRAEENRRQSFLLEQEQLERERSERERIVRERIEQERIKRERLEREQFEEEQRMKKELKTFKVSIDELRLAQILFEDYKLYYNYAKTNHLWSQHFNHPLSRTRNWILDLVRICNEKYFDECLKKSLKKNPYCFQEYVRRYSSDTTFLRTFKI